MIYYTYTYRHELRDRIAKSGEQNKSASSEVYEQQLWELVARLNAAERSKYTLVAAVFDGAVAYTDATAKAADVPMTAWRAQAAAALSALTIAKHECTVLDARWTKTSSGAKIARTHSRLVTASLPRWAPLHAVRGRWRCRGRGPARRATVYINAQDRLRSYFALALWSAVPRSGEGSCS
jgi:hypothetical protein